MKGLIGTTLLALCVLLSGCAGETYQLLGYDTFAYFNTQTTWAFAFKEGEKEPLPLWHTIQSLLSQVENSLSTEKERSSVSRFNRAEAGERVEIDERAYALFQTSQALYEQTAGAYNPATGLLVDLWGFSPRFSNVNYRPEKEYDRAVPQTLPDEEYITAFSSPNMLDFSAVTLTEEAGKYYAQKPANAFVSVGGVDYVMQLNFGGTGKGYCVDVVGEKIVEAGHKYGYFSLGGSSMFALENPLVQTDEGGAKPWEISVVNPRRTQLKTAEGKTTAGYLSVTQKNTYLSTSGDYENYYEVAGKRYCHIVNPTTGYPVNADPTNTDGSGVVSATVFGLSATAGDAMTTALMVMGKDGAIAYARENLQDKRVLLLTFDGESGEYVLYTNLQAGEYQTLVDGLRVEGI